MTHAPRYVANTAKALEVVLWLANEQPGIDVYHVVKAVFYADKHHVTIHGRPICGDSYSAAPYGPLAQIIHGILRQDPISMLALGDNGDLPFEVNKRYQIMAYRSSNPRRLSASEVAALRVGLGHVRVMSFGELYDETHNDPAYINAGGGRMDYRDFLPEDMPDRHDKAEDLADTAGSMVC